MTAPSRVVTLRAMSKAPAGLRPGSPAAPHGQAFGSRSRSGRKRHPALSSASRTIRTIYCAPGVPPMLQFASGLVHRLARGDCEWVVLVHHVVDESWRIQVLEVAVGGPHELA